MSAVPALLVTHADLGAALLRAAEQVHGPVQGVGVLSNAGLSREALERAIAERVASWTEGGLVLTDFWGGSCHQCGVMAARGHGEIVVVTGINLPALLDYLYNRERFPVLELADRLREKAQASIRIQRGQAA